MGCSDATEPAANSELIGIVSVAQLAVDGMHCGSCVALIEKILTQQSGVQSASVDLESARAVVQFYPSQLGVAEIRAAIAEAGYSAKPVG